MILTPVLIALYVQPTAMDDIHEVRSVFSDFNASKWKKVGRGLGISDARLDTISSDHLVQGGAEECLDQAVQEWLKRNYDDKKFGHPTWDHLANAVEKSREKHLANKIRKKAAEA